jgi:transcriptional regulator with XRE-family HTH domain
MISVDGGKIRAAREKAGLTLRAAATKARWGPTGWTRWSKLERGTIPDPRISTLGTVAKVLGCRIDDLVKR